MNTLNNPDQFTGRHSDALAIFKEGIIFFATNSFEKLYNPLTNTDKERFDQHLCDLQLDLQESKKTSTQKRIALISIDKEIDIVVYLLNIPGTKKNSLLVLVDPKDTPAQTRSSIPSQPADSDPILKKVMTRRLSPAFSELVGEEAHFKAVLLKAQKAAKSDYPVLIEGESGTGKEILARMIHRTSARKRKRFVDINCATIPDQLMDSELFGYEKGSFTGAIPGGRHGLFFEAHQGTLFFDEIADASLQTQAKLLRVLNEGCFKRIGGRKNIEVDVRIISATNKNLSELIKDNLFREDLIFRLNTIRLHLPPLRNRPKDIPLLVNFFLMQHSKKQNRTLKFSKNCLEILKSYHWPGNVRELKGVVDYMVTMTNDSLITQNYFPDFLLSSDNRRLETSEHQHYQFKAGQDGGLLFTAIQQKEREIIKEVLGQAKNRSEAIKILGISRRTFYSKLKQYNLD